MYEFARVGGERVFVVLKITERKIGGVLNGIYNLLVKPRIYLEEKECLGTRFALINAESLGGRINWRDIENTCGVYADKTLIPEGIFAPAGSKIKAPATPSFNRRVLARTACEVIKLSRMPMYRRVLGLIDMEAAHSDMLDELLMHYASIRVVTKNTEKYMIEARRVMDELGAPVMVSESFNCLRECVIALSPSALCTTEEIKAPCPVVTSGGLVCAGRPILVTSLRITPGKRVLANCPEGINSHFFAGAAYEFNGAAFKSRTVNAQKRTLTGEQGQGSLPMGTTLGDFGNFVAGKMLLGHRETGIHEVVRAVIESAGYREGVL